MFLEVFGAELLLVFVRIERDFHLQTSFVMISRFRFIDYDKSRTLVPTGSLSLGANFQWLCFT